MDIISDVFPRFSKHIQFRKFPLFELFSHQILNYTVFVNFAVSLSLFLILQVETICDMMLCQMDFLG